MTDIDFTDNSDSDESFSGRINSICDLFEAAYLVIKDQLTVEVNVRQFFVLDASKHAPCD